MNNQDGVGIPAVGGESQVTNGNRADQLKDAILWHLKFTLARDTKTATNRDWWISVCEAVEDEVLSRFGETMKVQNDNDSRRRQDRGTRARRDGGCRHNRLDRGRLRRRTAESPGCHPR